MKTITSPASTARDQRDVLIARVIRHRARIQRKVERMQAADEPGKGQQATPASGRAAGAGPNAIHRRRLSAGLRAGRVAAAAWNGGRNDECRTECNGAE